MSVPKELVALMSAIRDGEAPDPEDPSRKIYRFNQRVRSDQRLHFVSVVNFKGNAPIQGVLEHRRL